MNTPKTADEAALQVFKAHEQTLSHAPMVIEQNMIDMGAMLGALFSDAEARGDTDMMLHATGTWERAQETHMLMRTLVQGGAAAGIILTALKLQRDELAVELATLLQKLGYTPEDRGPFENLMENMYQGWRESLDTSDIESDAQDELLEVIKSDFEYMWNLPEGFGHTVLMALRGREEISSRSADLLMEFFNSLAQDAANV